MEGMNGYLIAINALAEKVDQLTNELKLEGYFKNEYREEINKRDAQIAKLMDETEKLMKENEKLMKKINAVETYIEKEV